MGPRQYTHWHQFFENMSVSSLDVYRTLEAGITDRKVPGVNVASVERHERGPLSSVVLQIDAILFNTALARRTFSRIVSALAVHVKLCGFALCLAM